jgi:hypothetical protein
MYLKYVKMWTGFIWLSTGTRGKLFYTQQCTFSLHKIWGISGLAKKLLALQG